MWNMGENKAEASLFPFSDISACLQAPDPWGANLAPHLCLGPGDHVFWGELAELPVAGQGGPVACFPSGLPKTGQAASHPEQRPQVGAGTGQRYPLSWAGREILGGQMEDSLPPHPYTHPYLADQLGRKLL